MKAQQSSDWYLGSILLLDQLLLLLLVVSRLRALVAMWGRLVLVLVLRLRGVHAR